MQGKILSLVAALTFLTASATFAQTDASSSSTPKATDTTADQLLSGTVVYQETVKFDIELPPQMERMRDRIQDTRTANVVLLFDETRSLSQLAPEAESDSEEEFDRGRRRFRMFSQRPDNATFVDFDNEAVIQRREFLDRVFLVEGGERPMWKLTSDMSEFLGYMCHRAVATIDTTVVEAWFTPEIPVPAGPDEYYGLPGLILVLTTNNGNRSFVATDVSLRVIDPSVIAAPTEGRRVTSEEFEQIVEEKRKEMESMRGSGRSRFIIRG